MILPEARRGKPCAVYHRWKHPGEPPAYANLRTPTLLSIATLRAVSAVPVVVLDIGDDDWGHFPEKLGFSVQRAAASYADLAAHVEGWKHLSRLPDVAKWLSSQSEYDTAVYVDSDVFWLRDPLPLRAEPGKFHFNGWNTGFYYHGRCPEFFQFFETFVRAAAYSEEIRSLFRGHAGYDAWYGVWDEMVLRYMVGRQSRFFSLFGVNEHATTIRLAEADPAGVKMLHCNGTMVADPLTGAKHARGLLCLMVREFYDNVSRVVGNKDMELIFGRAALARVAGGRFGLFADLSRLLATRDENGHFHADRALLEQ